MSINQEIAGSNNSVETVIGKLQGLSLASRTAVVSIIDRLGDVEGVCGAEYRLPLDNFPL